MVKSILALLMIFVASPGVVSAFNGHGINTGPLSLSIGQVSQVEAVNRPCDPWVTHV